MNDKLKKLIFDKLYDDLNHLEIIDYKKTNTIWFIDREKRYWYLIYEKTAGILHWRWDFFINFFHLFSMESDEFKWVISEWAEEILNCKVNASMCKVNMFPLISSAEEILNCKVNTLTPVSDPFPKYVKEVLNKWYEKY